MIREKLSNDEIVDVAQLARNGSGITETIIKMGRYESISGSFIIKSKSSALMFVGLHILNLLCSINLKTKGKLKVR